MMHSLRPKSTVTGNQDKESALKEPTIKGYGNYRCPHLVRAARGRKSPFFDFKRYKNPVVCYGGQHEKTRPTSKIKSK